jgi:hypothetical protein
MEFVREVKREVFTRALRTRVLSTAWQMIYGLLDRVAIAIDPLLRVTDRAAAAVIGLAFVVGTTVFYLVPADPARLTRFTAEHVAIFSMKDSSPQRVAFSAFIAILLIGAVALRLFRPARPLAIATVAHSSLRRVTILVILGACVINSKVFDPSLGLPWQLLEPGCAMGTALYLSYLAAVALFIWNQKLPTGVVLAVIGLIVFISWAPAATGLMLRIPPEMVPMVDLHMTSVFGGADTLAAGYRLFVDVPANYGVMVQVALAALLRAGHGLDLGGLIHLTEVFQATTLCLFALAAWVRTRNADTPGRVAGVFLVLLVVVPFLAMENQAVLLANQSGLRFVMLPVGALAAMALERWPLARGTAFVGAVAALALLHNIETGIAILFGLGLGWLVRARAARTAEVAVGVFSGSIAFAAMLSLAVLAHFAVFGRYPAVGAGKIMDIIRDFGSGFAGLELSVSIPALVILGHAGYVVLRALAFLLGRPGTRPAPASAAIAGILIAWTPYYVNRPSDWNLWSFLALYAVLLAPTVARVHARSLCLAAMAMILLVPIPLGALTKSVGYLRLAEALPVTPNCAAGLSLTPEDCLVEGARAGELARFAGPGDVVWLTTTPILTLRLSHLRLPVPTLGPFIAARTEKDLDAIAAEIAAAKPIALVLDVSVPGHAIPGVMQSLHARIADRAGFVQCPLVARSYWQTWLPKGTCQASDSRVAALRGR